MLQQYQQMLLWTFWTIFFSDLNCTTVSAPTPNCIFPFEFQGKVHENCAWDPTEEKYWCSTLVFAGKHVQGYWEYCDMNCLGKCVKYANLQSGMKTFDLVHQRNKNKKNEAITNAEESVFVLTPIGRI